MQTAREVTTTGSESFGRSKENMRSQKFKAQEVIDKEVKEMSEEGDEGGVRSNGRSKYQKQDI